MPSRALPLSRLALPRLSTLAAAAAALLAAPLLAPAPARADADAVEWDVSVPWGATEFHTLDAIAYAEAVAEATGGAVKLTVHPAGALGIKGSETLRAVEDGAVPMAEYGMFVNVGDVPILGIEAIPFLVDTQDDLKVLHALVRPVWEAELEKRNQKALYIVPWPAQNFFTKEPVASFEDLSGMRMRTSDGMSATMVGRLGLVPLQLNNTDIVPALATGKLDAVMTSGATAVAQKYWEFLNHVYNTNHLWASNVMAINLDDWNELTADQQAAMERVAQEMEPGFWAISRAEHARRMEELAAHGMTVDAPSPEMAARMREVTADMADDFAARVPGAGDILAAYKAEIVKGGAK
ncbi:MAG: TRAP transporter substrate-binding protein [Pseudomonadota bacterium]|nr:TRAP transporter substrate-binding protein [Pseudomonadota bacterium]MEE3101490.1 TRAP transporter substrate-binding protein [Pseudomonadota bacterium]